MKTTNGIILVLAILLAIFLFFPVRYSISFVNTHDIPIVGVLEVNGRSVQGENVSLWAFRGRHHLTFSAPYRVTVEEYRNAWWNPLPVRRTVHLVPATFDFKETEFVDLLGVEWQPEVVVHGKTIDGDPVDFVGDTHSAIPRGNYSITFQTKWLSNTLQIEPGDVAQRTVTLMPSERTVVLSEREAEWVLNFLRDYLEFSSMGIMNTAGWPKQFHLATKNATLSLGDMLLVVCEVEKKSPILFVPKNNEYELSEEGDCYTALLDGKVPSKIGNKRAEQVFYDALKGTKRQIPFAFGELNQRIHKLDWALSYDIEYGRYVPKVGVTRATFSSCEIAPEYLTPEQCENADFAGWPSNSTGTWWYGEYGYPLSSGLLGWRWILELGDDYGIPTTQYFVSKDLDLFSRRDPVLFEVAQNLAREGLLEVGSHTRYHTRLSEVPYSTAVTELRESKKELEEKFNVTVSGFRNPYLSLINNSIELNEQALSETGYSYYSLYGVHRTVNINGSSVEHKPINFFGYLGYAEKNLLERGLNLPYVISLDHPWNILFHEKTTPQGIMLDEAPQQPIQTKAFIFEAMSEGAWFTTVAEVKV